jgi:VWFA-related protein
MKTGLLVGLMAACAIAADPPQTTLIELNDDQLLRRVPELAGIRFDHDEALIEKALRPALESLDQSFSTFADLSAAEQISELRLEAAGAAVRGRQEQFRYVATMEQGSLKVRELRLSEKDRKIAQAGEAGFFAGSGFLVLMETLLPEFEAQIRFRTIGRLGDTLIFAFAQIPGGTLDALILGRLEAGSQPLQGLVWVDQKRGQLARMRCDFVRSQTGAGLDELRVDMTFREVRFGALNEQFLLPVRAVVDLSRGDVRQHAVHRFSDFRLYGREDANNPESAKLNSGTFAALPLDSDALELLGEGAAAVNANNAAAGVELLRASLRLNPASAAAHFHLGRALRATGDAAGAEREARAALSTGSGVPAAHNLLGVLLLERGAAADSVPEFREAVRVTPNDPRALANLSAALEATGDHAGALSTLQRAVELSPSDETLRKRLAGMTGGAPPQKSAAESQTVIRVDVRQVLVPVVVLDKEGHSVSDLKQSDFRILEDGVEQTVTSFRVETSGDAGVEAAAKPAAARPDEPKAAPARPAPARHTYLIVVDSLHADAGNLRAVHTSLQKFFASEPPGDSQYAIVALGQSVTPIRDTTTEPSAVLAALDDKAFYKIFSGSRRSGTSAEMSQYVNRLAEVRAMVDSSDPGTRAMGLQLMKQMPQEAQRLAGEDYNDTKALLTGLRELVRRLSAADGRRTILFVSEGFQISPGRDAWLLLNAFFPQLRTESLRGMDRMQSEFDGIVKIAARSNVVINTIDSRGLHTMSWADASSAGPGAAIPQVITTMNQLQTEAGLTLAEFAGATGGTSYANSNDILAGVRKAVGEGRNYYMLGYVSRNAAMDGKFRTISVEVKGRKVTLRAKRGYWATPD